MSRSDHAAASRPAAGPRLVERALWLVALLCLAWAGGSWLDGRLAERRLEAAFEERLASRQTAGIERRGVRSPPATAPAAATQPTASEIHGDPAGPPGATAPPDRAAVPLARLRIPSLDMSIVVGEGIDSRTLRRSVGWIPGTARPGDGGNVGLAAHRDRHFRPLADLRKGDEVVLETPEGERRYEVEWIRVVPPEDTSVLAPTPGPAVTLVTCFPFQWVGPAPYRFVARARAASPPGSPRGS